MFIDTHTHLLFPEFNDDRSQALKRAMVLNVGLFIEIACDVTLWQNAAELANSTENIYFSLGIHPQDSENATPENLQKLNELLLKEKKAVAIGETGLDYFRDLAPRDIQRKAFADQIELSIKFQKPLILHCREAYADMLTILQNYAKNNPLKGVVHCFSGSLDDAKKLIAMGFLIGIDGPVTYPSAASLKETVKVIPLRSILLETDSPYLPPQKYRGKRNEPAYLTEIAGAIASLKSIDIKEVETQTTKNALKLFGISQ